MTHLRGSFENVYPLFNWRKFFKRGQLIGILRNKIFCNCIALSKKWMDGVNQVDFRGGAGEQAFSVPSKYGTLIRKIRFGSEQQKT